MSGKANGDVLLSARGLSKWYGPFKAVDAVDLDVRAQDIHVLIGPNGAGKSTILNLLGGQIVPSAGEVYLDGRPLGRSRPSSCRMASSASSRSGPPSAGDRGCCCWTSHRRG
jgi:ABC-type branched-subunit amino acid transport system ATPase component